MSIFLIASVLQLASGAISIDHAEALARRDEASLSSELADAFFARQGNALGRALLTCGVKEASEAAGLMVVLKLDEKGRVVETWLNKQSTVGTCFQTEIRKFEFPADGRPEFYTFIKFDF